MTNDLNLRDRVKTLTARIDILDERLIELEEGPSGSYPKPIDLKVMALSLAHQVHGLSGVGQSMIFPPEQVIARAKVYLEFLTTKDQ